MTNSGVQAIGVWKRFRRGELHDSLRDLIPALSRKLLGPQSPTSVRKGEFWALRDVSFEVKAGEALGVIGPNGAGKSTLLKLLTRILRPTQGRCAVQGRIGALIEIAAGFHPDLTGRENVFLQGAIMGMTRRQIQKNFDPIVAFAGVEDFIDTPVKHYSSGMNARLGFSIAAHLDPDVLIIDEVLAVGDFQFQERAFERIRLVVAQGIPVVVVSHQLDRVASLCTHALLLDRGQVIRQGTPAECIEAYVLAGQQADNAHDYPLRIQTLEISPTGNIESGGHVSFAITGSVAEGSQPTDSIEVRVRALQTGQLIYATSTDRFDLSLPQQGRFELHGQLQLNLAPGLYAIETIVYDRRRQRLASSGPYATVQVHGGPTFWGSVQMNASMQLNGRDRMRAGSPLRIARP